MNENQRGKGLDRKSSNFENDCTSISGNDSNEKLIKILDENESLGERLSEGVKFRFDKVQRTKLRGDYDMLAELIKETEKYNQDKNPEEQIPVSEIKEKLPEFEREILLNNMNFRLEKVRNSNVQNRGEFSFHLDCLSLKQVFEKVQEFNNRSENPIDTSAIEAELGKIEEIF